LKKKLLQNVGNNVEEEGGEGVALPEATPALDPPTGDAVQENDSLTRVV
jgi:hypothetical protein